jgi:hypothetical protein
MRKNHSMKIIMTILKTSPTTKCTRSPCTTPRMEWITIVLGQRANSKWGDELQSVTSERRSADLKKLNFNSKQLIKINYTSLARDIKEGQQDQLSRNLVDPFKHAWPEPANDDKYRYTRLARKSILFGLAISLIFSLTPRSLCKKGSKTALSLKSA